MEDFASYKPWSAQHFNDSKGACFITCLILCVYLSPYLILYVCVKNSDATASPLAEAFR